MHPKKPVLLFSNGPKHLSATVSIQNELSDLAHYMLTYSLLLLNKNRKVGLKLFQFLRSPKNYVPDVPNIKTPHFTKLPDTIFCCANTSGDGLLEKE